jgi:hypothetical protein
MKRSGGDKKKVRRNIARALAEVPIDTKQEREALLARLRQNYSELEQLKDGMAKKHRECFEEIGDLLHQLEDCERRPPQTRSGTG